MRGPLARAAAALIALTLLAGGAVAQPYPSKPIRLISPYGPGGGNDTISRVLAERLGAAFDQRVVVDNRPGGNTMIANEILVKSPADGYTLILNGDAYVTNPIFYAKIPYDATRDILPIALVAFSQLGLVVNAALPAASVRDLIALAKAQPGRLNFGTSGHGGPDHLADLLFNQLAGVDIALVPYKGSALAITDLLGGQVQLMITPLAAVQPHIRSGKLRLLAFATAARVPQFPDVPTLAESGVASYEAFWFGLMAPAGTPRPIVQRLSDEVNKILRQKDVVAKFAATGVTLPDEAAHGTPEKFAAFLKEKLARNTQVAKEAGIRPE